MTVSLPCYDFLLFSFALLCFALLCFALVLHNCQIALIHLLRIHTSLLEIGDAKMNKGHEIAPAAAFAVPITQAE